MNLREKFDSEFTNIIIDNISGSVKILENLIYQLDRILATDTNFTEANQYIVNQLNKVGQQHSDLVVIEKFKLDFMTAISTLRTNKEVKQWLSEYQKSWQSAPQNILNKLIGEFDFRNKKILVHSYSQTVVMIMAGLKKMNIDFRVVQTEARPMYEGRIQALQLHNLGIEVQLIIDMDFARQVKNCDIVLLGSDQYDDNHFLNKTGSLAIVLIGREAKIPLYVLSDSRKKVKAIKQPTQSASDEIWEAVPSGIQIENIYLESIPLRLITSLIDES